MTATAQVVAGGVGSADRALVARHPIFIARGAGPRMWDVDGNEYVDYLLGYGPLVLGHAHPRLVEALNAGRPGLKLTHGVGHPLELAAAERLTSLVPSMEQVRFGQSGTEAVESAITVRPGRDRPFADHQVRRALPRLVGPVRGVLRAGRRAGGPGGAAGHRADVRGPARPDLPGHSCWAGTTSQR